MGKTQMSRCRERASEKAEVSAGRQVQRHYCYSESKELHKAERADSESNKTVFKERESSGFFRTRTHNRSQRFAEVGRIQLNSYS